MRCGRLDWLRCGRGRGGMIKEIEANATVEDTCKLCLDAVTKKIDGRIKKKVKRMIGERHY